MNDFLLIRKNLFRKKLRAILMLVSIFIAFLIFGVLAGFERAFNAGEDVAAADRLVVVNKINFTQPLPIAYFNRVRGRRRRAAVDASQLVRRLLSGSEEFPDRVRGRAGKLHGGLRRQIAIPPEATGGFLRERTGALVGEAMAKKWGWKVGDRVPIMSNIFTQRNGSRTWDFTIAGIFTGSKPQADTNFMVFQYQYFNETQNLGRDMIGWMALNTTRRRLNEQVMKAIDQMFANSSVRDVDRHRKGVQQGVRRRRSAISR